MRVTSEFSGDITTFDLTSWTHTIPSPYFSSDCKFPLVGGYSLLTGSMYLQKSFTPLPFYSFNIKISFAKIDNWQTNNFQVFIDTSSTPLQQISYAPDADSLYARNLCGKGYNEAFDPLEITGSHTTAGLKVKLTTDLTTTDPKIASWGFSNFEVWVSLCHPTCLTCNDANINNCLSCYTQASLNSSNYCLCNNGYYMASYTVPCTASPCSSCLHCDSSCLTCVNGSTIGCLSCASGKYLLNGACLSCNTTTCLTCDKFDGNCTSCQPSATPQTYLVLYTDMNQTCSSSCPFGTYPNSANYICTNCDVTCRTCSAGGPANCITCANSFFQNGGVCQACDPKCSTCSGTATYCLSCPLNGNSALYNNDCVTNCPALYYKRVADSVCQPCDVTCKSCSGPSISDCTGCYDGSFVSTLPSGSCSLCDISCKTCSTSSTHCDSCDVGLYLSSATNVCGNTCPDGTFPNSATNKCQNCNLSCGKCTGGTASDCTKCADGYFLSTTGSCLQCSGCKTCAVTAIKCLTCNANTYLSGTLCKATCPTGFYGDSTNLVCLPCDSTCQSCTGNLANQCSGCVDGQYLTSDNECLACSSSCLTCSVTEYNCLSCKTGTYLQGTNCVTQCLQGFWANSGNSQCQVCDTACATCKPLGTSSDCLTCNAGMYLSSNQCQSCSSNCATCSVTAANCTSCSGSLFLQGSQCKAQCNNGFYGNTLNNICSLCHASCLTCSGGLSSNCLSCSTGLIFKYSKCFTCDPSCATCDGSTSNDCLSCNANTYLQVKTCVSQCKSGYYPAIGPPKTCQKCNGTCLTCVSDQLNACLTCPKSYFFQIVSQNPSTGFCQYICPKPLVGNPNTALCETGCDIGKYIDSDTNQCRACSSFCETCSGPKSNQCLSCRNGLFKRGTTCSTNCQLGEYVNNVTQSCDACSEDCLICENQNKCTQCDYGFYLRLKTNLCANQNEVGEYLNFSDYTVRDCQTGCLECESPTICSKCDGNYYLLKSMCKYKTFLEPILKQYPEIPNVFSLSFNDTWLNLFKNLTKNSSSVTVYLDYIPKTTYQHTFAVDPLNKTNWIITLDFFFNCPDSFFLNLTLLPPEEDQYNLTKFHLSLNISKYLVCEVNSYKNSGFKNCSNLTFVTPTLSLVETNPLLLTLSFDKDFPDLFNIFNNITTASIEGLSGYSYYFNRTSNLHFLITISAASNILNNLLFTLNMSLPPYIKYHPKMRLNKTMLSIPLFEYYILDQNTKDAISFVNTAQPVNNLVVPSLAFLHGIFSMSMMSFVGVQALNIIRFLRYLEVNYPPHVLAVFKMGASDMTMFPIGNVDDETVFLPKIFKEYGVQSTFLANSLEKLLKIALSLLATGLIEILLRNTSMNHPRLLKILEKLSEVFYLNIPLMLLFSSLMDLSLFAYLNIKFPDYTNKTFGSINLILSFVFVFSMIALHFLLYRFFLKASTSTVIPMTPLKSASYKNICPESPSIPPKSPEIENGISFEKAKKLEGEMEISPKSRQFPRKQTWWDFGKLADEETNAHIAPNEKENNQSPIYDEKTVRDNPLNSPPIEIKKVETIAINPNEMRPERKNKLALIMKDFQQVSRTQKLYVVFLMMRYMLLPAFVVEMYDSPGNCISAYTVFNVMFLIYILCIQPFANWTLFFQNLVIEFGVMLAIFGSFMIVFKTSEIDYSMDSVMMHGWMIFYGSLLVIAMTLFVYAISLISLVSETLQKVCKKNNKVNCE